MSDEICYRAVAIGGVRMKRRVALFAIWLSVASMTNANATPACPHNALEINGFMARWDERYGNRVGADWILSPYSGLPSFRRELEGPQVVISFKISDNVCISQIVVTTLRSSSTEADAFASLLAWVAVFGTTNPTATKKQREDLFHALGIDSDVAGASVVIDKIRYTFSEDADVNKFTVVAE
ncbi:hypothetical protein [Rhizobium sp. PAMB 3182]